MANIRDKMKKTVVLVVLIGVIIIAAIAALILSASSPTPTNVSVSNIQPVSPHYIGTTRIFLISTTPSYGYYPTEPPSGAMVQKGDPCFFINITIRNDYNSSYPPDNYSPSGTGTVSLYLTAKLYDKNGNTIDALDATLPIHNPTWGLNVPIIYLQGRETTHYQIIMKTSNRNIDHYEVVSLYAGSFPVP
jgi:hypothetical protein